MLLKIKQLVLAIQSKKIDYNTKSNEIEEKITDHDHSNIYITPESFVARLKQANLASKSDIANFVKKTHFDDKLKNLNKKFTSNKTKKCTYQK